VTDWLTIPVDDLPSAIPAEQRERLGVTERQLQVIQLLALGQQNKQISRAMGLSATTVNVMRHHIKVRMRLKSIIPLIIAADRLFREEHPCDCQQPKPPKPDATPASSPAPRSRSARRWSRYLLR
jgi:DNA-binding CsgD family transcriptional regulator